MTRFLFIFGFESPEEHVANQLGSDFESSHAVWVRASSAEEAMLIGRSYADEFVAKLYRGEQMPTMPSWTDQNFAHWISSSPLQEYSESVLESFDEIRGTQKPA
jgi:hypothetical protein